MLMVEDNEMHPAIKLTELIVGQNFSKAIQVWRAHMSFKRKCNYRCEDHGRKITETLCGHCLENMLRTKGFKAAISGCSDNVYSSSSGHLHQWLKTH